MERAGDLKLNSSCLEVKDPVFVFNFFFILFQPIIHSSPSLP